MLGEPPRVLSLSAGWELGGHSQDGKGAFSCARVRFKEKGVFGIGSSDIPRFLSFFVKGAAIGRGLGRSLPPAFRCFWGA